MILLSLSVSVEAGEGLSAPVPPLLGTTGFQGHPTTAGDRLWGHPTTAGDNRL